MRKNFIFSLMLTAGTLAAVVSCEKEKASSDEISGTTEICLTVPESAVKTALGEAVEGGRKMVWSTGDVLNVNGRETSPLDAQYDGLSTANFTVEGVQAPFNAIYPASGYSDGLVTLPSLQQFVQDGFDPSASIMLASGEGNALTMKYACAYVRVSVSRGADETLDGISLYSGDATAMSGRFSPDFAAGTIAPDSELHNGVQVSGEIAYDASGKASAVLAVAAGTYPKGFFLAVSASDGSQMSKKAYSSEGVTLVAGQILDMPELTFQPSASLFSGGSGTQDDPYRIATAADISLLSTLSNGASASTYSGKYYVQVADIDMTGVTVEPVSKDASVPFAGEFDGCGYSISNLVSNGGLFGYADGAHFRNITLERVSITSSADNAGCLLNRGNDCDIENVSVSGSLSGKNYTGAIAGYFEATEGARIYACSSDCAIEAGGHSTGGICGVAYANANILIDSCAAYGEITGKYNMGGICGYAWIPTGAPAGVDLAIVNCVFAGERMVSTQTSSYLKTGGIVGWQRSQVSGCTEHILNNVAIFTCFEFPSAYTLTSTQMYVGGIIGQMNNQVAGSAVEGCWSTFQLCNIWRGDYNLSKEVNNNDANEKYYYGGVAGYCVNNLPMKNCYHYSSTKMCPSSVTTITSCGPTGPMSSLVTALNGYVSSYSGPYTLLQWTLDSRGYPTPGGIDTARPTSPLRISVIGDSISTFRSWIPIGNAVYYSDSSNHDVHYDNTYWYTLTRLIANSRIEKNISWSGSCVSSFDDQVEKPGFTTRMASDGLGSPDIVIIHGGTNDCGRSGMYNTAGYAVGTRGAALTPALTVPESVLEALYAKDASQLDTQYYLDSYVKLIKQIRAAHPAAKIVILVGDRFTAPQQDALHKIAAHYADDNVRIVDYLEDGYDSLPKYSGSHPTAGGHTTMARKIYSTLGSWLGPSGEGYTDFSGSTIEDIGTQVYW